MAYILGPRERKEIYLELLEAFKADRQYTMLGGMCSLLAKHSWPKSDINYFPELIAQKPKEKEFGPYWWGIQQHSNGREKRIEALKRAIKLVNKLL